MAIEKIVTEVLALEKIKTETESLFDRTLVFNVSIDYKANQISVVISGFPTTTNENSKNELLASIAIKISSGFEDGTMLIESKKVFSDNLKAKASSAKGALQKIIDRVSVI